MHSTFCILHSTGTLHDVFFCINHHPARKNKHHERLGFVPGYTFVVFILIKYTQKGDWFLFVLYKRCLYSLKKPVSTGLAGNKNEPVRRICKAYVLIAGLFQ